MYSRALKRDCVRLLCILDLVVAVVGMREQPEVEVFDVGEGVQLKQATRGQGKCKRVRPQWTEPEHAVHIDAKARVQTRESKGWYRLT